MPIDVCFSNVMEDEQSCTIDDQSDHTHQLKLRMKNVFAQVRDVLGRTKDRQNKNNDAKAKGKP